MFESMAAYNMKFAIVIPILISHGNDDQIADPAGAQLLYEILGSEDKSLMIYDGLKHELFNQRQRQRNRVLEETLTWLNRHC